MNKIYEKILGFSIAALILILFVLGAAATKKEELEIKIAKQEGTITQLEKQIKGLKKENEELEKKYYDEKQLAEYWYYYNVDDAC